MALNEIMLSTRLRGVGRKAQDPALGSPKTLPSKQAQQANRKQQLFESDTPRQPPSVVARANLEATPPLERLHPALASTPNGVLGSVIFESNPGDVAKFVRLPNLPEQRVVPKDLLDLVAETWGAPMPCALISMPESSDHPKILKAFTKSMRIALQRGIAECIVKTQAWVITSGHNSNIAATIAGQALRYARRELDADNDAFTCIGVIATERLDQERRLAELRNGSTYKYRSRPTNGHVQSLEASHTHFVLIDNEALDLRMRFEKRISSFDISGDGINTPKVLLVIAGDHTVFEQVAKALDPSDPSTGVAVPVLVIADSGGAASDIKNYVIGKGCTWPEYRCTTRTRDITRLLLPVCTT